MKDRKLKRDNAKLLRNKIINIFNEENERIIKKKTFRKIARKKLK